MGTTLQNGIFLPAEGERNCYTGLASNWTILDGVVGGYSSHAANLTIHVTAADKEAWNGKADASALTAHTGNTTIHVTAADKEAWNGKADASALTAHTGDTTIHVTAEDKTKWDAVTTKANDTDVVHKAGEETIPGRKILANNRTIVGKNTDISSLIQFINADVIEGSASGSSGVEVYGSSISDANKIGGVTFGEFSNNGGAYAYIECNRTANGVKTLNTVRLLIRTDNKKEFSPAIDNDCRLGMPSFRWSDTNTVLINGFNPGALFLPQDRAARVDISAYFTNTANGATNRVTPPEDGYIFLSATDVVTIHCVSQTASNLTHYAQTFSRSNAGQIYCLFPVRKNDNAAVQWYTTAAAVSLSAAYFIPCKGNV